MSKRVLLSDQQENEQDTGEVIDHLIHEMENQLQVTSMEAHLRREPQCVFDAAESIEKLERSNSTFWCLDNAECSQFNRHPGRLFSSPGLDFSPQVGR